MKRKCISIVLFAMMVTIIISCDDGNNKNATGFQKNTKEQQIDVAGSSDQVTTADTKISQDIAGSPNNNVNDHEFVDLGLPSGTLWATCNVGATTPEGNGNYYAWGETRTKAFYNLDNYHHASGSLGLTKYCSESDYDCDYGVNGFTDDLTILQTCDDAATANWGTGWRMPTEEECEELLKNTTNKWTTKNGVRGKLFTAKNGKTLFLPAAGYHVDDELWLVGDGGFYWSGLLDVSIPSYAVGLCFSVYDDGAESDEDIYYYRYGDCNLSCNERYSGFSVRPVCEK